MFCFCFCFRKERKAWVRDYSFFDSALVFKSLIINYSLRGQYNYTVPCIVPFQGVLFLITLICLAYLTLSWLHSIQLDCPRGVLSFDFDLDFLFLLLSCITYFFQGVSITLSTRYSLSCLFILITMPLPGGIALFDSSLID